MDMKVLDPFSVWRFGLILTNEAVMRVNEKCNVLLFDVCLMYSLMYITSQYNEFKNVAWEWHFHADYTQVQQLL